MKIWKSVLMVIGTMTVAMGIVAFLRKPNSIYRDEPEEKNPFEGKRVRFIKDDHDPVNADGGRGHLEEDPEGCYFVPRKVSFYEKVVKRGFDIILSLLGMIVFSPIMIVLSLAIFIDDPGPVLFTQKRLGEDKRFFKLHKFRSMKMSTPHDIPTHMLADPKSYITRVGRILRKLSLDELPQLWDIFIGNMSLVGPRPALWNQEILIAEREKYNVNEVRPGLTGWAQVNGRDELELDQKAMFDGEYCKRLSFRMDLVCVLITVVNVLKQNGIIEGGTGALKNFIEDCYNSNEV